MVINNEFRKDAASLIESIDELATGIVNGTSKNIQEDITLIHQACGFLKHHFEMDYDGKIAELQEELDDVANELNNKTIILDEITRLVT